MAGPYETLVVERHGPVGWLVFNRPGAANAMDARMLDELEQAWVELDADPSVRVIVNTGEGRAFQTGVDVVQLSHDPQAMREQSRRTRTAELKLTAWHNRVAKPVIAAVNGVCAGGGLHFVADADIVIAASDATFLDPHVSVGQVTAYEAIGLMAKMPVEAVMRMAFVGRHERMSAQRASRLSVKARGPSVWSGWPHIDTSSRAPARQASVRPISSAPHSARLVAAMAAGEFRAIFSARSWATARNCSGGSTTWLTMPSS
jgi:enoyl-CoA hydratase/carnithine racemase